MDDSGNQSSHWCLYPLHIEQGHQTWCVGKLNVDGPFLQSKISHLQMRILWTGRYSIDGHTVHYC